MGWKHPPELRKHWSHVSLPLGGESWMSPGPPTRRRACRRPGAVGALELRAFDAALRARGRVFQEAADLSPRSGCLGRHVSPSVTQRWLIALAASGFPPSAARAPPVARSSQDFANTRCPSAVPQGRPVSSVSTEQDRFYCFWTPTKQRIALLCFLCLRTK